MSLTEKVAKFFFLGLENEVHSFMQIIQSLTAISHKM